MQSYLRQNAQGHLETALAALDWLSLTIAPSLPLMQALLAGAILFQYQGDADKCWTLIAHASTVCKVLGWHIPATFTFDPNNEPEAEILAAVHQCYVLDKTISMNHNRPFSLPELDFLSILSSTRFVKGPFSFVIEGGLLQAQTQEKIIRHLQPDSHLSEVDRSAIVTSLARELLLFKSKYDQASPSMTFTNICSVPTLDFAHYSLMTVVCRYDPFINKSTESREKCLSYAREALLSIRRLRDPRGRSNQPSEFCSIFIVWSMLIFPLSPYFIVFCNVVTTSHMHDFELLSDIVDILAQIVDVNYSIRRLHSLCSMLLNLCKSIMNSRDEIKAVPPVLTQTPFASNDIMATEPNSLNAVSSGTEASSENQPLPIFSRGLDWSCPQSVPREGERFATEEGTCQMFTIPTRRENISTCNEDTLWQLFEAQPNFDWLESDISSSKIDL
ncbi:hypothetical protein N7453_002152 [Penicillium expansum]|nr:hypothetical protein N7453_002152 [Penicillium expansum]